LSRPRFFFAVLFVFILIARLCHVRILWDEDGYPLAGALQMLSGKMIYRDFWFDKPPLLPVLDLAWGAQIGWPLRFAGALYVLLCCWLIFRFARSIWGDREAMLSAGLLAFFLTFWMSPAVMPLGPDLLLVAPHIAAVYFAWRGRAFWSGVCAGVGLLLNTKAVFVLAAAAIWQWRSAPALLAGFVAPNVIALAWLAAAGALGDYWQQVWSWGWLYAGDSNFKRPLYEGARRTLGWLGFHLTLVTGGVWFVIRERTSERTRFVLWAIISGAAVVAGWRFFPRYYFALLPVSVLVGARGLALLGPKKMIVPLLLLVFPLVRFAPTYGRVAAGGESEIPDLALAVDSRNAAALIHSRPGDTLLVWGYRPDLFAYTRLPAGTPFLDSQPLTGVIADRHLSSGLPTAPTLAASNRAKLTNYRPTFVVDGLGPLNAELAINAMPDLADWMKHYQPVDRTRYSIVYRLKQP
jgi:dolichyl-phosphate-mannose-protein mannosyltransferase